MMLLDDVFAGFSMRRVSALLLRYTYLLRSSWPRILEMIYWPTVEMLTWGFIQLYLAKSSGNVVFSVGTLIGAMLLWDILFRSQFGFSISFLEEIWSRNMGNLLMSPLRPLEFVVALMLMSLVRLAISLGPVMLLAVWFFGFNYFSLGIAAVIFFINLVLTGWAIGLLVSGLILLKGLGAESFAWSAIFIMSPLACVYYPVSVLPHWLQTVSWMLPPTYVFEGLRALLIDHQLRYDLMAESFALNLVAIAGAIFGFLALLSAARKAGSLVQMGE